MNRDTLSGEALFILKQLKDNFERGRSNKLAEVKTVLEPSVSLEFDSYFFFLRKFHYLVLDRASLLRLTEAGEKVAQGEQLERFTSEVSGFFAEQIANEATNSSDSFSVEEELMQPPAPPMEDPPTGDLPPPVEASRLPPLPALPRRPRPLPGGSAALIEEPAVSLPAPVVVIPPAPTPPVREPPREMLREALRETVREPMREPERNPAPRGTELDLRYSKFDPIGSGPLGVVFKGRHSALGMDVCIKELKDIFGYFSFLQRGEVIKRLKRELCGQAQVRHPGVVAVLDQNTEVARPYFVVELLRGSLKEKLEQGAGKGVPVGLALRWFLQLCYALRAAHTQGVTHHNLKPENVLFDAYGNAKLGDFGLGRVIEVDQSKGMPQVFVGTGGMGYMPPELITRSKDAGPSADVYALGILFYEMVTGQLPGRRSPMPSEVNREVPEKLDGVFDKMTQDRRESRYPDFDAVLDDFYAAFPERQHLSRGDLVLSSEPPKA